METDTIKIMTYIKHASPYSTGLDPGVCFLIQTYFQRLGH